MKTIFAFEMKNYYKSMAIWMVSIASIIVLMMVFFPLFSAEGANFDQLMADYPEALLKAFGMSSTLSLTTVLGYFSFVFALTQLALAIQACNYGFSILSVEEREFTADFLLSKPVSRQHILIGKFLAAMLTLAITGIFTFFISWASIELFRDGRPYDQTPVFLLLSTVFLFQLCFLSIGMAISVLMKRIRSVLSFSLGLAFGTYMLNAVRGLVGGDLMGLMSPFYHFDAISILEQGTLNLPLTMLNLSISIVSLAVVAVLYPKRDIPSL